MQLSVDFAPNTVRVEDYQPTVVETDASGFDVPGDWPGYLGTDSPQPALSGYADNGGLIPSGILGELDNYNAIGARAVLRPTSGGWQSNREYGGEPGRIDRLAADLIGPAHVGTVESFRVAGSRLSPGRADLAKGGPVGTGDDLGAFLAVAMEQSTYDMPIQDESQLHVLMAL